MRRKKAIKRGRVASVLVAAVVGYLLGSWNAAAVRSSQASSRLSAAQTVALRFPSDLQQSDLQDAPTAPAPSFQLASASTVIVHNANSALFAPEPMLPAQPAVVQTAEPVQPAQPSAPVQVADLSPTPPVAPAHAAATPILPRPHELATAKPHAAPVHHQTRPGHMFDDAQLASIKRRLNLTPDQEQMWPAVAAALRNIGLAREREARAHGGAGEINPDSPQVADLKSAAIPLIMSFSDEQKDEVRTLARGMGLSRLASQF